MFEEIKLCRPQNVDSDLKVFFVLFALYVQVAILTIQYIHLIAITSI